MRQSKQTTWRRVAFTTALAAAAIPMTGCYSNDSQSQAAASRPVLAEPYVVAPIPVADRFGTTHDLVEPLATEPRADVAVMESVAMEPTQSADLPPPASATEPWWKKIEFHGSITFGYSHVL